MELQKRVIKHISLDDLQHLIRKEKNKHIYQRLLFIRQLYAKEGVEDACQILYLSKRTGYNWLEQWNEHGCEGLIPNFGGGRPPKLDKSQMNEFKKNSKPRTTG